MYEHKAKEPLSNRLFAIRIARHLSIAVGALAVALGVGVLGYHFVADLGLLDALLNASMILGGMGPVDVLTTSRAKFFASFYALFSGLVAVGIAGVMFAPIAHRMLHMFHWDDDGGND